MEILANNNSTCLELTIAMPGISSSPSFSPSGKGGGGAIKEIDINQLAPSGTDHHQVECMEEADDDDDGSPNNGPAPRKKLRLTKQQSRLLEQSFLQNHTLNPKEKEALAVELNLKTRQIEVWFQNRRARSKMKQTEMECEYLKKWFGSLTEQNKRLQKEVEELRAIQLQAPPHNHHLASSTRTMCPRCERVVTTAGNNPAVASRRNH
ncbi:hypothetical protein CASFOL_004160 [Castilleja foliolosa]|uniref:Homeobox domain-containing protein n=1 Tax=Castilleja foliolosa TaxID=1961234 RepID=A0ABD3EJU3_9LAMI